MIKYSKPILPTGYTQLEYIEADGRQYEDTEYHGGTNTKIVLEIKNAASENAQLVFGTRDLNPRRVLEIFAISSTNTYYLHWYDDNNIRTPNSRFEYSINASDWVKITLCKELRSVENLIDSTSSQNANLIDKSFTLSGTLTIGNGTVIDTGIPNFIGYYRSIKIYDGTSANNRTLVQNYIPCKDSNNRVGLYDTVNNRMHYSTSGVDWIPGPEVPTTQVTLTTVDLKRRYISDSQGNAHEVNKVVITNNSGVPSVAWRNPDYYGVKWSTTDTTVDGVSVSKYTPIRTGRLDWHATLPIHNKMRRCILKTNKVNNDFEVRYIHPDNYLYDTNLQLIDYTKTSEVINGITYYYDIMVEIPEHWYKAWSESINNVTWCYLNLYPYDIFDNDSNYRRVPKHYVGAFEAMLDRTNNMLYSTCKTNIEYSDGELNRNTLTYSSDASQFMGGDNNGSYTSASATWSLMGRPVTNFTIEDFVTKAKNRNADNSVTGGFALNHWASRCSILRLYLVEYASFNSQDTYNSTLTNEGYHQGGLGRGVVTNNETWTFNDYRPCIPCGATLRLGSNTGIVKFNCNATVDSDSGEGSTYFNVPSYRGIENPFAHIWEITNGMTIWATVNSNSNNTNGRNYIFVPEDEWYNKDFVSTQNTNTTAPTGYKLVTSDLPAVNGWITSWKWDAEGEFVPTSLDHTTANTVDTASPLRDYSWAVCGQLLQYKRLMVGGSVGAGSGVGLFCFGVYHAVSGAVRAFGSRLLYMPVVNN